MISFDQLLKRELQSDFTIRLKQDRMVKCEEEKYRISKYIQTQSPALVYQTKLDALNHYSKTDGKRKKRKARIAELELRFANVEVLAPACMNSDESLPMAIVEVREITANLLPDKAPLHWLIWTSIHLKDASDSLQILKWYLLRWTIEQLFRTMKSKGFNQQTTQLGSVDSILKQTITTFKAATQVMQLVQVRNQENAPAIEIPFDQPEQQVLKKVNERLQGKTEKLKNPFSPTQLSYAAWVMLDLVDGRGIPHKKLQSQ